MKVIKIMKIRIWLKVAQNDPLGLVKKIFLLNLDPDFSRTIHFTLLYALLYTY